jgi:hypothetical protein
MGAMANSICTKLQSYFTTGGISDLQLTFVTVSTMEISLLYDATSGAGRIGCSPNIADLAAGLGGLVDRSRLRGFDKKEHDGLDEQNSELHLQGGQGRLEDLSTGWT